MTTESKKVTRQQLCKVTQNIISPARVRRFIDNLGINRTVEEQLKLAKLNIVKIKKEGGPVEPISPKPPKKNCEEPLKLKYEELKNKYLADLKVYNDYTSEKYKRLRVIYKLCKYLLKVKVLLLKKTRNVNQNKEMDEYVKVINSGVEKRKSSESDEEFLARSQVNLYSSYLANVDLTNVDSITKLIDKLKSENPGLDQFLEKDTISKLRVRFNDPSAVAIATAMEFVIEELLEHGMAKTIELQKKTIQPDYCITDDIEDCQWYVLFRNLPHLKAIVDRQNRKNKYFADRDKEKQKQVQKAKSKAKKDKKNYVKPSFKYPTFQDNEVAKGHAVKLTKTVTDSEGKETTKEYYEWKLIDAEDVELNELCDDTNFYHYVQQICKKIIARRSDIGDSDYADIKISTNIKKFFSDLIIDFIAKISPQFRVLIDAMDVKTIDHTVVKTILKMLLVNNYFDAKGEVKLNDDHELLFKTIDEKVELCQAHQKPESNDGDLDTVGSNTVGSSKK